MHIVIVADAYPPTRNSAALMLQDLASGLLDQGNTVTVIVPSLKGHEKTSFEDDGKLSVLSIPALKTKDVGYLRRTVSEFFNPFLIARAVFSDSQFLSKTVDGIIWYSPSIFWGPLIRRLKTHFGCKAYLILRDIFPDWALDLGLLKPGIAYESFKKVEHYQYQQADVIGVQSPGSKNYFLEKNPNLQSKTEVLWNWIQHESMQDCPISIKDTKLHGKIICVYAGNIGVAQGGDLFFEIVKKLSENSKIGFIFVGRGSEMRSLRQKIEKQNIDSVMFFDEISPKEVSALYTQCHIGLIILDPRHTTHNIPGKFMSYMGAGLPSFALVNSGNDLLELINDNRVGTAFSDISAAPKHLQFMLDSVLPDPDLPLRCESVLKNYFTVEQAVSKISKHFE
jgi:glycosyltransferase involved in cell wall biosynthesis